MTIDELPTEATTWMYAGEWSAQLGLGAACLVRTQIDLMARREDEAALR